MYFSTHFLILGNLVTPSWWTDLWLNEGFASYVEYLGVEAAQPQLKLLEQFVSHDMQHVLTIDSLATSHPISIPVKHPDEINEIFDRISYAKGIFQKIYSIVIYSSEYMK